MTHRSAIAGQRGGGWTPAMPTPDNATLLQWFDAAAIPGISDQDLVATWPDLAGTSNASQSNDAYKPTYLVAGGPSENAALAFSGSQFLAHAYAHGGNPITIFAAAMRTGEASGGWGKIYEVVSVGMASQQGTAAVWGTYLNTQIGAAYSCLNTWRIMVMRVRSGTSLDLITDGVVEAKTGAGYYAGDTSYRSIIGGIRRSNGTPYEALKGRIAEIIVYDGAISDADLACVHAYMAAKHGIALA